MVCMSLSCCRQCSGRGGAGCRAGLCSSREQLGAWHASFCRSRSGAVLCALPFGSRRVQESDGCPSTEPSQLVPLGLHSAFVTSNAGPGHPARGSPLCKGPASPGCQHSHPAPGKGHLLPLGIPARAAAASLGTVPSLGPCPALRAPSSCRQRGWAVLSVPSGKGEAAVCSWEFGELSSPLPRSCLYKPSAWPGH